MDAASEYHGVTKVKETFRGYLREAGGIPQPKRGLVEHSLRWYNQVAHLRNQPQLAQLDANEDALARQLEYEDVVMLHSGYAPERVRLNRELVHTALNAMSKVPLLTLPAEIRAAIWDYALSFNELVFNYEDRQSANVRYPENAEAQPTPELLQVCKQIRSEATPIYLSNQTFSFFKSCDDIILDAIDPSLRIWLQQIGPGVKAIRRLGVDIEDEDVRLQMKLIDGECFVTLWVWDWDGDEDMNMGGYTAMMFAQILVSCIEKVVKGVGIKWPEEGAKIEIEDHLGPLPCVWSDEFWNEEE